MLVDLGPDHGDDRVEGLGIVDRQLGEALAVEADLRRAAGRGSAGCSASPRISAAAESRMMNSLRNSRFRARRSRNANMPARSSVSLAERSSRRRPPTKPFAR